MSRQNIKPYVDANFKKGFKHMDETVSELIQKEISRPQQTPEKGFERLDQLVRAEIGKAGPMTATTAKTAELDKAAKSIYVKEQAMRMILNDIKGQGRPPPRELGASSGPLPGPPQPSVLETVADAARGAVKGAVGAMGALT